MAIQFSDTTNYRGLVQLFENEIGAQRGDISGNTEELKNFTALANNALDSYFATAIKASGTWELDDTNHDDYAVIYTTLVSGQRDYSFLTDQNGNAILDIYKVLVLPPTGSTYQELVPVDENASINASIIDEDGSVGTPNTYAKRANAIHFDVTPNYTVARGVKILINRESSYFTYTDTTKKPGYPYHQEYFYLKPAKEYARIKTLTAFTNLEKEVLKLEGDVTTGRVGLISQAYGRRKKDESDNISGEYINSI